MSCSLDEWQKRLRRHYTQLRAENEGRPLFALEHGLSQSEIERLQTSVRKHIAFKSPSPMHNLVWVVYSAEIGYGYSGNEYWQTFENMTPGWALRGNRHWLRECYEWFHDKLGGIAPTGSWANHFSIICWPITHAILPRDLQHQLAQILYELRHSFSADLFESPHMLGEFIATRSWNASSRFQNITEETELVGQIAAALLLHDDFGTNGFICPETLNRISADLNRERMARKWLQSARHIAQQRTTVRGLTFVRNASSLSSTSKPHEARAEIASLGIEPRLLLRPSNSSSSSWDVFLDIPDLSQLLMRFPQFRDILTQSRCVIAGSNGRPLARGRFLYGSQRINLVQWPRYDEVLLRFDKRNAQLEALLRTECLIQPGSMWLFRIASDGLAYEVRNLRVRPGNRYILVRPSNIDHTDVQQSVPLTCEGVSAVSLALPEAIDSFTETNIQQLGLEQSKTIEVWPVGLAPSQWNDDGYGEWLASERPCLGIRADHSVSTIVVSIDSGLTSDLILDNLVAGDVAFVELPQLPVGLHTIRFASRRMGSNAVDSLGDLKVLMRIRESRPWSQSDGTQGPLLARIEPPRPTLEQLWEGRAEISVQGPPGRKLSCTATLIESGTGQKKTKTLPSLTLPVNVSAWAHYLNEHLRKNQKIAAAYDAARTCELCFTADELGAFTLRCERDSTPLRWILRHQDTTYEVQFLNDSGLSAPVQISSRCFEHPDREEILANNTIFQVPKNGGMFIARQSNQIANIIAPPIVTELRNLGCNPVVRYHEEISQSLTQAWQDAELWNAAKVSGGVFSLTRQREVLATIQRFILKSLCGHEWIREEDAYYEGTAEISFLQRAVWEKNHESEIAQRLKQQLADMNLADISSCIREMEWTVRFLENLNSSSHDPLVEWFAEFALRVASDPAEVKSWSDGMLQVGIDYLIRFPTFLRAARFLAVVIDKKLKADAESYEPCAGWRWK